KILEKGKVKLLDRDEALARIARGEKVENDIMRNYLYKDAFADVLGCVRKISDDEVMRPQFHGYVISDFDGKMGLEKQYELLLHGTNGKELYEVDAIGKKVRSLGRDEE